MTQYISIKNEEERLVSGPTLIPGCPDCDFKNGEKLLSKEEVKKMAFEYIEKYRISDADHDYHRTQKEVATPVASWISDEPQTFKNIRGDEVTVPAGSWFLTLKIHDDKTWERVKKGELQGFSVTAISKEIADKIASKERVLMTDLKDPVIYTVSLVENPCVYNAIFTSVKEDENAVVKAGRRISDKTLKALRDANEAITKLLSAAESERSDKEDVNMTIEEVEALVNKAIDEKLQALKESEESQKEDEEDPEADKEEADKEDEEEADKEEAEPEIPEKVQKELEAQKSRIEELEKQLGEAKPESQALKGQDGEDKEEVVVKSVYEETGRDLHGRAIRK